MKDRGLEKIMWVSENGYLSVLRRTNIHKLLQRNLVCMNNYLIAIKRENILASGRGKREELGGNGSNYQEGEYINICSQCSLHEEQGKIS